MTKFFDDFSFFWEKIIKKENFTFARYADGEIMLMKGIAVDENTQAFSVDKWSAPNYLTKVGKELLSTLNHTEEDYYYAISSPTDDINDYNFLKNIIKQNNDNLTFANLWINSNYNKSIENYRSLNRDVILICNYRAREENFPFNVSKIIQFPDNCISFWEENGDSFIKTVIDEFTNTKNQLFFISCGPVSEIIIHNLYSNNRNNTYIDVGSSIDEYVHGNKTRPYMDNNAIYNKIIPNF